MRKTLLLLFASGVLLAQNTAELFNTNWYISQMIIGGQTTVTPTMDQSLNPSVFNGTSSNANFSSKYFNVSVVTFVFSTTDNLFVKNSSACTLADYWGNNMTAVQGYDQKNCDFFVNPAIGQIYNYQVVPNGLGKTLIITNPSNGNKIYYNNMVLATKDNDTKAIITFQNPVKDKLIIENIENNLSVQVFNILGQSIYEGKTTDRKVEINTQNFAKGQYILMLQGQKPQKFIKE